MKKTTELAEASIGRLMLKYFVPAFIGVFVNALYNIVDRIFIGQGVGAEALSGISVIFPVMLIMMGFGMLIGIGAGVLVSINLGRRDHQRAEHILGTSFVLMILVSALIMVIGFAIKKPMLQSFGATDETFGYANDYLNIILLGVVFQVVGFSLNNIIRSEGSVKTAMYSMLISAGTNLILDPIFIFGLGMGVKGAAWATVISMFVLCVWVIAHFRSSRSVIKLRREQMVVDWQITKEIIAIGMAPFSMQIAGSFVQGLLNKRLIDFGGDLAVGAMGIINSVATMVIMTIVAINMASQPIIGFNFGAKDGKRVKDTLRYSLIAATIIAVSSFILIEAMPGKLVALFNRDSQELYDLTVRGLRIIILAWPVVGFQVVAGHFFQSVGKAKIAMFLTLLRQVIVLLPLLVVMPGWFGLNGIWAAFPVADAISAMVVSAFLLREWRNLDKLGKE
jgi:putative MATE family efflux protein